MSSSEIFWGIGDFAQSALGAVYDNIGNVFNYSCIVLGFVGLFIWLKKQHRFSKEEEAARQSS